MGTGQSQDDLRRLIEHHLYEAERLLEGAWISSHVKAQAHASLALYYEGLLNGNSSPQA